MKMKKIRVLSVIVFLFALLASLPVKASGAIPKPDSTWVDSVFNSLTIDQRIAQLFIIRAFSDKDSVYNDSITNVISKWNPGGVCFFKGAVCRQASLTNTFQQHAQTPLLIAIDAEYGLGMRLDSAFSFPRAMTLGALPDDSLIGEMAALVAKDCRRMGIHMNFAPDVDINNNPDNPVIGFRSFGEDPEMVARRSTVFMKGLQSGGILTTAKHFPGHGDTDSDSHLTLPVIYHDRERLDSVELYPFREAIRKDVDGIMIAHLFVPAFDSTRNTPATLSRKIVTGLLKEKMGFKGFVITDALDMKGITKHFKPGEIEVKALLAGNDILLLPKNLETALNAIRQARDSALIPQELIDQKCRTMLSLKYKAGLKHLTPVSLINLPEDLNSVNSEVLARKIFRNSITLVKNENQLIPVNFLDRRKIAMVFIGDTALQPFQEMISRYAPVKNISLPASFPASRKDSLIAELKNNDLIIIGLHCNQGLILRYGIQECALELIDTLSTVKKVILDVFGSPYALSFLKNPGNLEAVVASYQDCPESQALSAELIFGAIKARGHLPVTASHSFPYKTGISTTVTRLEFVFPEEIGIPSEKLMTIDSLVLSGINKRAYPGCQVVFAFDGKIFYNKSFGHPRYEDTVKVNNANIYDLASLTKVAATTLAIMKLVEEKKILLDEKLGTYLPELKGSNKQDLVIRDVMTHQAGLQAWIPFYLKTLQRGQPDPAIYQHHPSEGYPLRVAEDLYIRKDYPDSVYRAIMDAPLRTTRDYKYSDMGFYLLRRIIEKVTGEPMEEFLSAFFYKPLGLSTTGFLPRKRFPASRIMPTEYDTIFRKQLIRGDVHDPGAAMLGGVSGHAGLFSNAADLAVLLQLFLNNGDYGGKQYFLPSTIKEFTRVQFPANGNRRALGFDKPALNSMSDGPSCKGASPESFGHSGFTGTYIWADPEIKLSYIFLSNRVYPDASNEKIVEINIRTRIHQAMYDILEAAYMKK
jgi:beta-glucosidase-like glycosyl hydrolase/CubicO group peptidase (beta-lactamase class C family)